MISINNRCWRILEILLRDERSPIPVRRISEELGIGERTARYDISQLARWLEGRGVTLERRPRRGVRLAPEGVEVARRLVSGHRAAAPDDPDETYLTGDERCGVLLEMLLEDDISDTVDEVAARLGVSRTTCLRDFHSAEEWFARHGERLARRQRKGVALAVDEHRRRLLAVERLVECAGADPLYGRAAGAGALRPGGYLACAVAEPAMGACVSALDSCLRASGAFLTDDAFMRMAYYLAVLRCRAAAGRHIESAPAGLGGAGQQTMVEAVRALLGELLPASLDAGARDAETAVLLGHLMGSSRIQPLPVQEDTSLLAESLCAELRERVQARTGLSFCFDRELACSLRTHVQAMLIRSRMGMPAKNPLIDDIRSRFPDLFDACARAVGELGEREGLSFSEEEAGFVALYFGVAWQRSGAGDVGARSLRALLICGSGMATVSFLSQSLAREFPHIEIVGRIPVIESAHSDFDGIDLVLSTVEVPWVLPRPVIRVSPMLTRMDVRRIDAFLRKAPAGEPAGRASSNEIMELIRATCTVDDLRALEEGLSRVLDDSESRGKVPPAALPSLLDLIPDQAVLARVEAASWDEALGKACAPLLESGAMTLSYLAGIRSFSDRYEQYGVILAPVCAPHAEPDRANRLSVSLATLAEPVFVSMAGQKVGVQVLFVLALSDTVSHAAALDELFSLCDEFPDFSERLCAARSSSELRRVLRAYCKRLSA